MIHCRLAFAQPLVGVFNSQIFSASLSLSRVLCVRAHTTAKRAFETRDWKRAERAKSDALGWRYVTLCRKVQCMMESVTIKTLSLVYRDCPAHRTPFLGP